ncbi:hypothetical protein BMETH_1294_2 [methanotrophic bacterial endosymbiont of Bathymodiolus sp.]|nr:hypothetical protein BMETH_1294_2 [methanotrophic bacterial endosymbiont of Bathymodiolus sp.]
MRQAPDIASVAKYHQCLFQANNPKAQKAGSGNHPKQGRQSKRPGCENTQQRCSNANPNRIELNGGTKQ